MLHGGQGRGPAGVTGKGIQGRLELMLEYAHEQRAPSLFAAIGHPGANPSPSRATVFILPQKCTILRKAILDKM